MSKDASHTYIHLHASHHADLFEEFCHPPSAATSTATNTNNNNSSSFSNPPHAANPTIDMNDPTLAHIPGHFLPFESINLPPHLMPLNPEDEDGVVPDMHAAFGIARAMGNGMAPDAGGERSGRGVNVGRGEEVWRDLGLEELVDGTRRLEVSGSGGGPSGGAAGERRGLRREGRRGGILSVR
ncbi:hypothetical protein H2198_006931 [Neophaeococcomyces mojaviensis]|uniref:Uncharacterized protein n=1 Tax=Neophaeococcomyces mojaviensis TaxID=3383035 RepID=A0ACC3A1E1_9EURO|nr:hypothetical protein H2198_006931 [Knufia sp. JES_112]